MTMTPITSEYFQKRLAVLEENLRQASARYNIILGAIQEARNALAEIEKGEEEYRKSFEELEKKLGRDEEDRTPDT